MPSIDDLRSSDAKISNDAWNAAFSRLWQTAFLVLNSALAGPQHAADREDIAARSIEELTRSLVAKKLDSFNRIETFDDLLNMTKAIVRARTKDYFRGESRRPEDLVAEPPESIDPSYRLSDTAKSGHNEDFELLILRLPFPQPAIFRAHYVEGRTAEEISRQLGIPRGTVLSYLFRGKAALRKYLDGESPSGSSPSSPS